ncbi:MAG: glycosyltransferase [Thermoleophilia bacterium]|nr:glycosyltransferase [Thermoleophilia bacterium]
MILTESSSRASQPAIENKFRITTSWDDGHILDFRVAGLLEKYNLQGTFYVAPESREIDAALRLDEDQIRLLGSRFEIGAHTFSHPNLAKIPRAEAVAEIIKGKEYLEGFLGREITSFCYPYGGFNQQIYREIKRAGFTYARSVRQFETRTGDPFAAATTVHAYPHLSSPLKTMRAAGFNPAKAVKYLDWSELAITLFNKCRRERGVFHLWGHSWEIDKHDDWGKLEKVFAYIADCREAEYLPNSAFGRRPKAKLLIASSYFPPKAGGLERYAGEMAKGAARNGYEVEVITSGESNRIELEETGDGLSIRRLPVQFRISDTPVSARWFWNARRLIRETRPDIINVHLPVPFLADLVAFAAKDTPVIVTCHSGSMKSRGLFLDMIIDIYEKAILPFTLRKADRIICSSEFIRRGFLKKYESRSVSIHPGVDTSLFKRRSVAPISGKVLFVGDFRTGWKGLDYLVDAIRLVPEAELHIVGRGERFDSPRTTWHGVLAGSELVAQIQESQMLVLPSISDSESFGMVLIEAMACGVPVIATDVGGIPDVITDHEDGLLVPPRDPQALAGAISYIIDNPVAAERLAENAYKKVLEEYDWGRIIEAYLMELAAYS